MALRSIRHDAILLENAVRDALSTVIDSGLSVGFIHRKSFYHDLNLRELRLIDFDEEVNDILSASPFIDEFGTWIFACYLDGFWAFTKIAERGEPNSPYALVAAGQASIVKLDVEDEEDDEEPGDEEEDDEDEEDYDEDDEEEKDKV